MLHFPEREAWKKTPYQIIKLFKYHKEYNSLQFGEQPQARNAHAIEQPDAIDVALGGL